MIVLNPVFASTLLTASVWFSVAGTTARETHEKPERPRSISVTGRGEVAATPDLARVRLGVETRAESASSALSMNNRAMEKLFHELRGHRIAKTDTQTTRFQITPRHERDGSRDGPPKVVAYEVINEVLITVRRIGELGRILDAVVGVGANRIHAVQFEISEREKLLDRARRAAIEDAQRKAAVLADAAGEELGPPLEISESSSSTGPRPFLRAQSVESAGSVPIARGESVLTTRVNVTFELRSRPLMNSTTRTSESTHPHRPAPE